MKELEERKKEFKQIVINGIGKGMNPANLESYQFVMEEAIKNKERVSVLEDRIEELKKLLHERDNKISFLSTELASLQKD